MFLGQYPALSFGNKTDYTKPREVAHEMPKNMESLYGVLCPKCLESGQQNQLGFNVPHGISCERERGFHKYTEAQFEEIKALAESVKNQVPSVDQQPQTVNGSEPETANTPEVVSLSAPLPLQPSNVAPVGGALVEGESSPVVGGDLLFVVRIPEWLLHPITSEGESLGETFAESCQRIVTEALTNNFGLATRAS